MEKRKLRLKTKPIWTHVYRNPFPCFSIRAPPPEAWRPILESPCILVQKVRLKKKKYIMSFKIILANIEMSFI